MVISISIPLMNLPSRFLGTKANVQQKKNESFADDSTTFTLFTYEALSRMRDLLMEFSLLSGLRCNLEKTTVMRIGRIDEEIDPRINDLGFTIVKKSTLLGFVISDEGNLIHDKFKMVDKKVNGILNFWRPFFLSLGGKVTIIKSLVIPPINYHASILMPDQEWLDKTAKKIENFVTKGFNIGTERLYQSKESGGIGLFNLRTFITGLQCAWVGRALRMTHDNWSYKLTAIKDDMLLTIGNDDILNFGPVLQGIVKSFMCVRENYMTYGDNFINVPIFGNTNF
jgi:hypothetical protein